MAASSGLLMLFQHQQELIAAQTGQHVLAAHVHGQALGQGDQQFVADRIAQAVVDVLEAIQVDVQHADW